MFKIIFLLISISLSTCEPPSHSKPLIFPTWSSKTNLINNKLQSGIPRNGQSTLVIQIRSDSAMPSLVLKQRSPFHNHHQHHHPQNHHLQSLTHNIRPVKMALAPHFVVKSAPIISKLARKQKPKLKPTTKAKLNSVKPPLDYIYEKPFTAVIDKHKLTSVN